LAGISSPHNSEHEPSYIVFRCDVALQFLYSKDVLIEEMYGQSCPAAQGMFGHVQAMTAFFIVRINFILNFKALFVSVYRISGFCSVSSLNKLD
jgi:hypothetical protein